MLQKHSRKSEFTSSLVSKHDGKHNASLVAGGHLTPDPIESIYSGVVSIRSLVWLYF